MSLLANALMGPAAVLAGTIDYLTNPFPAPNHMARHSFMKSCGRTPVISLNVLPMSNLQSALQKSRIVDSL